MIEPGDYYVTIFGQVVRLEVDVIPADRSGKEVCTWDIISIKDINTNKDCYDGVLMDKIEEHIYHLGLRQVLSDY